MTNEVLLVLARDATSADPERALAALAGLRREIEHHEIVLVRTAQIRGMSMARIASAMGVSRQAVHRKYGRGGTRL